jgi:hypothetical protein
MLEIPRAEIRFRSSASQSRLYRALALDAPILHCDENQCCISFLVGWVEACRYPGRDPGQCFGLVDHPPSGSEGGALRLGRWPEGLATGDATSSIVAISWVGLPLTFRIYPDARQAGAGSFGRLQRFRFWRIQRGHERVEIRPQAIGRLVGCPPFGLDVAPSRLPSPCASLPRSADLGRHGSAGRGHVALGGGNRRKGLAVSSALKKSAWVASFAPQKYNSFSCLRAGLSGGSFAIGRITRPMRPPTVGANPAGAEARCRRP